ncbi:SusC/RagA family TonB-linked outer membrane protein [Parabacteroides pacaensis]|uniref:SusC/RagA family TonB-linked outer membrane protein n=1 Tax=Parabacteroides pacaensis TaxID=2086575 RepID=UPI000D0E3D25|nr:TonB-dependent receptor [Parabacteroides pacaensis]
MKNTCLLMACCISLAFPFYAKAGNVERADSGESVSETSAPVKSSDAKPGPKKVQATSISQQKNITVTGKVLDANGEPVIGASVVEKGVRSNGTITDMDGTFSLSVTPPATLEISYIGYVTQQVQVIPGKRLVITLLENVEALDEVVVTGYGQQRVATVTGSVSQVKTEKIAVAPVANVSNMLAGQLPGLVSKQTSGLPGLDDASLNIRGFDAPLIIVDGIETSFNNIDANQIETVSILKDGAASIYGARAGNGVILVTTKRGKSSKPTIMVNSSYTLQGSTNVMESGSSAERAQYARDTWINSGNPAETAPYTEEDIRKYREGTDPGYLNTDWFGASIRKFAPQQNHNVSISGGNENTKYYGYFGYNTQETILKKNGGHYDRYNFQSNVDTKITERLSASMDLMYIKDQRYYTSGADMISSNNNFWNDLIYRASPMYPLELPDPSKLAYAEVTMGSPVFATNSELAGYVQRINNITQFKGTLQYDFKYVPGLKAKGTIIYRNDSYDQKTFKKQAAFYTYNADTEQYTLVRNSQDPTSLNMGSANTTKLIQQYSLNYDQTFLDAHHISGLFMFESVDERSKNLNASRTGYVSTALDELFAGSATTAANNSSSAAVGRASWIGRINYSYLDRYMVETILRADASSRFAKGHRWGYFPSVSLGWNIAREDFMKQQNIVDNLKVRLSYGESGYDAVANFAYLTGYVFDSSYTLGSTLISGLTPSGLPNINLTWEKMKIYNAGVDYSLWNRKLYGEAEFFHRKRSGIPGTRSGSLPSSFGAALPMENLNSVNTQGFEFRVGTTGNIGNVTYDVSGNVSYSRSKWDYCDEPAYTDADQERLYKNSGRYTDRRYGYVSDGLFTSQEEIDAWPCTFEALNNDNSSLRPGDIRYKDLNGDKVIDWRDQKEIGKGATPHWMFGFNFNLKYRNFDLSALFQGASGYTTYVTYAAETSFRYQHTWNERTNDPHALIARPGGSSTNGLYSDFNNHNTTYLRLKNMSFGYEIPATLLSKIRVSKLRIYFAGTNLFTLSSLHKYGVDPEMPESYGAGTYYPQQYTMSIGCNLIF